MDSDLPGQVRTCLGQPVRPVGNAANDRLPRLRTTATRQRRGLTFVIRTGALSLLGLEFLRGLPDPLSPPGSIAQLRRNTIGAVPTVLVVVVAVLVPGGGVLGLVHTISLGDHVRDVSVEPALATVGVDGGVRRDLGPIDRDRAEPAQPRLGSDHQHLREQVLEHFLRVCPEPGDRRVVRAILGTQDPKRHVGEAHPLDLPRRSHALAVGVDQQRKQHPRVITRGAGATPTASCPLQPRGVKNLDGLQHKPHQMVRREPLPKIHRQQHRLITQHRAIRLSHTNIIPSHQPTPPRQHAGFCDRLYDVEIRRVIYSTNAIESLNARFRRAVKARGHFPSDQAALKYLYLTIRSLDPTGRGRARWAMRWKPALNAFAITFEGRIILTENQ
jgi:hypothetical protein